MKSIAKPEKFPANKHPDHGNHTCPYARKRPRNAQNTERVLEMKHLFFLIMLKFLLT